MKIPYIVCRGGTNPNILFYSGHLKDRGTRKMKDGEVSVRQAKSARHAYRENDDFVTSVEEWKGGFSRHVKEVIHTPPLSDTKKRIETLIHTCTAEIL
jgi:hypothetical protein